MAGADVVQLLDRQHERLRGQDGTEFVHELRRFYDFITAGPAEVAAVLADLRAEGRRIEQEFEQHDAELVPELVDLKAELVARAPDADDSNISRPHSMGAPPMSWVFSFANFDQVATGGRERSVLRQSSDASASGMLVRILESKLQWMMTSPQGIRTVSEANLRPELDDVGRRLRNVADRHRHAAQEYVQAVERHGGFQVQYLDWGGRRRVVADGRWRRRCASCRSETSVTAGTIFAGTRTPLVSWFAAVWCVVNQKQGVSALGLQRVLGLVSYRTAWSWLYKLRRGMVLPGRELLADAVEVDESYIGGVRAGTGGRGARGKAIVAIAVEDRGERAGRVRMRRIPDGECRTNRVSVAERISHAYENSQQDQSRRRCCCQRAATPLTWRCRTSTASPRSCNAGSSAPTKARSATTSSTTTSTSSPSASTAATHATVDCCSTGCWRGRWPPIRTPTRRLTLNLEASAHTGRVPRNRMCGITEITCPRRRDGGNCGDRMRTRPDVLHPGAA